MTLDRMMNAAEREIARLERELDAARARIAVLEREAEIRKTANDRWVPCPDHRDKIHERDGCQVCKRETAERERDALREAANEVCELFSYGPLDGAATYGPDFDLGSAQNAALAKLAAALTRARPVEGWRPVETAPHDAALLLYANFAIEIGHYNTAEGAWLEGWDHRTLKNVTHWQPLPAAPRGEEG